MAYDFKTIEKKWQKYFEEQKPFKVEKTKDKKKFYCLEMLPYPSGRIHMGHVRNYSIGDVCSRYHSMNGYNVLHPMGWDSFGMPAENAAIKSGKSPAEHTFENIDAMRIQFKNLGFSYDWEREISSCTPEYYKWNQWFFIKMMEMGLAYRKKREVNWCPTCQTVLANEQAEGGTCWRCDSEVNMKELDQWFIKTTAYTEELLKDLDNLPEWPSNVCQMQRNWIGKSTGSNVKFKIDGMNEDIEVFTTRIDTIFGSTFMCIAPNHPIVNKIKENSDLKEDIEKFVEKINGISREERLASTEKLGQFTGIYAINPFTNKKIPVYLANFVLMEYGTGAVMSVPAHDERDFEFAKKYNLPIIPVISEEKDKLYEGELEEAFTIYGYLINSGNYTGKKSEVAKQEMNKFLEENGIGRAATTYRIKDWGISRQRYWGTPIPVIYCDDCGILPVPEKDLPVELPKDVEFKGEGGSPLLTSKTFLSVKCPKCGKDARRETDTMDTFMDSSWYYFRYINPHLDSAPFDKEDAEYFTPVDLYIGGVEHATMHLMYTRFFTKFLRDLGLLKIDEPVKRLLTQGMVIKDGVKMSKSKGNVVDPDDMIEKYGADAVRLFMLFAAPPEKEIEWTDQGAEGALRFLNRIWNFAEENGEIIKKQGELQIDSLKGNGKSLFRKLHQTILKVSDDIKIKIHLNTAIASMMELFNSLTSFKPNGENEEILVKTVYSSLIKMLNPFAPHMTSELGEIYNISLTEWPKGEEKYAKEDSFQLVVQVNGKIRAKMDAPIGITDEEAFKMAESDEKVVNSLNGKTIIKKIFIKNKLLNIVVR